MAGFFLTLGDVKAIIFYVSLFPLFIDLSRFQMTDTLIIILVTIMSIGGVKVFYALSAIKIARFISRHNYETIAKRTAGGIMIGAGCYLFFKP